LVIVLRWRATRGRIPAIITVRNLLLLAFALLALTGCARERGAVILATTTSTDNSGLLDVLVPMFQERTGYTVKVIAVGSGAALRMGERGDADVLLVHSPGAELAYMDGGYGRGRRQIMHNDFVLLGPPGDPSGVAGTVNATTALAAIADSESLFISRGDDSGTHARERALWQEAGGTPGDASWYQETGQGMGATLTIASQKAAYTLSDRATFLALSSNLDLDILSEGDDRLLNIYHVIEVQPPDGISLNETGARAFAEFLLQEEARREIARFGVEEFGQPLFFPDACAEC
jgi:tungstate transport system substrate-binding protein